MRIAFLTTFTASRKEPLAALLGRIHAAFLAGGLGAPAVHFSFSDAPLPGYTSSVDRVLKRHPNFARFVSSIPVLPGGPATRQISGEGVEFPELVAVAAGVPRSFPFQMISIQLRGPDGFGVMVGDNWWVNGRARSVSAVMVAEADPASKKLPPQPGPVAAVLSACGKIKNTRQMLIADSSATRPSSDVAAAPSPEIAAPLPPWSATFVRVWLKSSTARRFPTTCRRPVKH